MLVALERLAELLGGVALEGGRQFLELLTLERRRKLFRGFSPKRLPKLLRGIAFEGGGEFVEILLPFEGSTQLLQLVALEGGCKLVEVLLAFERGS